MVVLPKLGYSLVGVDRDMQIFQLHADVAFAHDAVAPLLLPSAARLFAWWIKFFAVSAQISGHVFAGP